MTRNISPLYCDTFYIAGTSGKVFALSKQPHIVSISFNCHSGYCMSAAVKASPENLAICTYRRPLLTAKVKVRNQPKMHPLIIRAFIHLLRQIRKLRRRADLIGIIFLTRTPRKTGCGTFHPRISFRSRTHRHGDPHQCRQCQQGQSHLHAPCFCTFLHNPHAFLYPAKFQIFPNPLQM